MDKTILFLLILFIAIPILVAMDEGLINVNETFKKEYVNGKSYIIYDDIKGEEIGIKAIYEGALGILPLYNMENETFRWPILENILGFGKVIIKSLFRLIIDILELIGKAITDGILSIF